MNWRYNLNSPRLKGISFVVKPSGSTCIQIESSHVDFEDYCGRNT